MVRVIYVNESLFSLQEFAETTFSISVVLVWLDIEICSFFMYFIKSVLWVIYNWICGYTWIYIEKRHYTFILRRDDEHNFQDIFKNNKILVFSTRFSLCFSMIRRLDLDTLLSFSKTKYGYDIQPESVFSKLIIAFIISYKIKTFRLRKKRRQKKRYRKLYNVLATFSVMSESRVPVSCGTVNFRCSIIN